MPRSDGAQAFFTAVYRAVQEIPPGKVTSYGHIARLVGTPQRPRQVGVCLKHLPSDPSARFNHTNVPWQRVINAKGVISPRSQPSGARNQAAALQAEGVTVTTGALGELMVDFAEFGWFPRILPSEEAEGLVPSDEDDEDGESGASVGNEDEDGD
ncbi:44ac9e50-92c8-40c0-9577-b1be8ae2d578 [Thermothielavioides terrestris]|uniref:44ac9e50-92c8-40c0-9577-b1be8ae2d578 n=1 Tax=Thermothielavioides terrestris TaxID=2587410 RepID=A0A446BXF3_9PEZI|nr:44ac9e50-92c8-40c0-9577-b1be8ae2d578 [Thermothielavioides terrestris]